MGSPRRTPQPPPPPPPKTPFHPIPFTPYQTKENLLLHPSTFSPTTPFQVYNCIGVVYGRMSSNLLL